MRELWNYLSGSFDGAERELKAIRKARTLTEYQAAAQRLLGDCPLRENAVIETWKNPLRHAAGDFFMHFRRTCGPEYTR